MVLRAVGLEYRWVCGVLNGVAYCRCRVAVGVWSSEWCCVLWV
jgi:hypothetical protein